MAVQKVVERSVGLELVSPGRHRPPLEDPLPGVLLPAVAYPRHRLRASPLDLVSRGLEGVGVVDGAVGQDADELAAGVADRRLPVVGHGQTAARPDVAEAGVVESVILLRYVELKSQLYRLISIMKMRESGYDTSIREFQITNNGIRLLEVYRSVGGVLVGSARREAQALQQKKARAVTTGKLATKARDASKVKGKSR